MVLFLFWSTIRVEDVHFEVRRLSKKSKLLSTQLLNDPKEKSAYFFEGMSDMSSSHTKPTSRMYEVILIVVPLEKFNILGGRSKT